MVKENTFRFREFEVRQNDSVHKVGTDGVLIGAWAITDPADEYIMDIGTGTGLIAMMLARRSAAIIHAIEPDAAAFEVAKKNISVSPDAERIKIFQSSLQNFETDIRFDRIVSNPPFFHNRLHPPDHARKMQRHTETLSFSDLALHVAQHLKSSGSFSVILPVEESRVATHALSKHGLFESRVTYVRSRPGKPVIRHLIEFTRIAGEIRTNQLTLHTETGEKSMDYDNLTRDFYL